MNSSTHVPSKEKLPDWLRRWYALKGELRFREAADEIERLQRQVDALSVHAAKWVTRALELQQRAAPEPLAGPEAFRLLNAALYYVPQPRELHKDIVAYLNRPAPPPSHEQHDWRFVAQALQECQNRLQAKDGGARHSWLDPALDIARGRAGSVPTKGEGRDV